MIYKATEIKITKTKLVIGVPEPFKLLHVTGHSHLYTKLLYRTRRALEYLVRGVVAAEAVNYYLHK